MKNEGLIQFMIIIVLSVIILSLLGVSLASLVENQTLKGNFTFLWRALKYIWNEYLFKYSMMLINQPFEKHLLPFLDYCEIEKGLSNNTQRNYRQYLLLFINWLKKCGFEKLRPHELTPLHIWDYRLYIARKYKTPTGEHLSKKSQNYYLIALRAFLNYLADRDIETLPSSKIKLAKQKSDENISFMDSLDVEKLLAVPDVETSSGLRDRAILELFFSSGMRISELLSLNTDQM